MFTEILTRETNCNPESVKFMSIIHVLQLTKVNYAKI